MLMNLLYRYKNENFTENLLCSCDPCTCATHLRTRNVRIADLAQFRGETFVDGSETVKKLLQGFLPEFFFR